MEGWKGKSYNPPHNNQTTQYMGQLQKGYIKA
jgi:hypothetical protein